MAGLDKTLLAYQIDNCKCAGSVSQLVSYRDKTLAPINAHNTKGDIGPKISQEEEKLESRWQRSHIDGCR